MPKDPFQFLNTHLKVSRETFEKLSLYYDLLLKWQAKVNLVSPDTIPYAWERHFLDSLQILKYLPKDVLGTMVDLGSGAGFPGMVLAIATGREIRFVESDMKKCIFLREVARICDARAVIHQQRIEEFELSNVHIITSRALADLSTLLQLSQKIVSRETICLFHKGKNYAMELEHAKASWIFDSVIHPSITDPQGVVIQLSHIAHI